ncbi:MAG: hypothetical protein WBE92_08900 [Steroidobacteraceae bacterium]
MNGTLDPRSVERPFIGRWLRATGALLLRSPLRFGFVIALLGWFDTAIGSALQDFRVQELWVDRVGLVILPLVWLLVCALARGADDPSQSRTALVALLHKRLWIAVGTGMGILLALVIAIQGILLGLSDLFSTWTDRPVPWHPGQFVGALTVNVVLLIAAFEPCYFPLLLMGGELTNSDARYLSRRAAELNSRELVWFLICISLICANSLASILPAFGLTESAFLVAAGIFNYIAYRDIFERRPENLPRLASVSAPVSLRG